MTTRRDAMRLLGAAAVMSGLVAGSACAVAATRTEPTGPWKVYTTAQGSQPFAMRTLDASSAAVQPKETETAVFINTGHTFQQLIGFGGAITDATAETYAKLTPAEQQAFLKAYFDRKDGIGYSVLRTTIHSSDFSSGSYTYVKDGDRSLASFSIDHDMQYRVPLLRQSLSTAKANGTNVRVFASPWSAPAWMKTNGSMLKGGSLRAEDADVWARYIVKFIQTYEKAGIPLWGLTVQNEPMATQTWESMIYTAEDETRFVGDHLGPALKQAGLGGKKLIVWDHNRDLLPQRAAHILSDPKAKQYIWGVGFHWYETWTGGQPMHRNVAAVKADYPNVPVMLTEASIEKFKPEEMQMWAHGERYGSEIMADLNAGAVAWVDWNMLLDSRGGPNHVGNYCFAPLHASDDGKLVFTPIYSYIGHFARFIRPDAKRVSASTSRSSLNTVAFRNADGSLAVVVMNPTDKEQRYTLMVDRMQVPVDIPAHAIQTLVR